MQQIFQRSSKAALKTINPLHSLSKRQLFTFSSLQQPIKSLKSFHSFRLPINPFPQQAHTYHYHDARSINNLHHLPYQTTLFGLFTRRSPPPDSIIADTGTDDDEWLPADPSQLTYDEKNIHFDLRDKPKGRICLLANGDSSLIPDSENDQVNSLISQIGQDILTELEVVGASISTSTPFIELEQPVLDNNVLDSNENITNPFDYYNDDNDNNINNDDNDINHDGHDSGHTHDDDPTIQSKPILPKRVLNSLIGFIQRQKHEAERPLWVNHLIHWYHDTFDYYFPQDILAVLDLTASQLYRIYITSSAIIKGYMLGSLITILTRHNLTLFSTIYCNIVFYPYIASYFILSLYVFANFIHITSVFMTEFPLIKDLIILLMEIQRLSTAPTYMIAKAVFKYARSLSDHQQKEKADQPKKSFFSTTFYHNSSNDHVDISVDLEQHEVQSGHFFSHHHESDEPSNTSPDDNTVDNDDDLSILDQIQQAMDDFKSPKDILQEFQQDLEQINNETDQHLTNLFWSRNNNQVDILVDEHVKIIQDTSHDTTLVEVSTPTPLFGSTIKVSTDNADIILHA